jgi:hypothetical protein
MSRRASRLVACLSLAVFLFAHTPLSLALSVHLRNHCLPAAKPSEPVEHSPDLNAQSPELEQSACCSKCRTKVSSSITKESARDGARPQSRSQPGDPKPGDPKPGDPQRDHPDSSCPCCPERGPASCPCPSGCAYCSVAKMPCPATTTVSLTAAPSLGDCLLEPPALYRAPFCSEFLQPPRA